MPPTQSNCRSGNQYENLPRFSENPGKPNSLHEITALWGYLVLWWEPSDVSDMAEKLHGRIKPRTAMRQRANMIDLKMMWDTVMVALIVILADHHDHAYV